jgi:hypothetical protein
VGERLAFTLGAAGLAVLHIAWLLWSGLGRGIS